MTCGRRRRKRCQESLSSGIPESGCSHRSSMQASCHRGHPNNLLIPKGYFLRGGGATEDPRQPWPGAGQELPRPARQSGLRFVGRLVAARTGPGGRG